jgi:hypothetical protein
MTTIKTAINGIECTKRLAIVELVEALHTGGVTMTVCYKRKSHSREVHSFVFYGDSFEETLSSKFGVSHPDELAGKVLWVIYDGNRVIGLEAMPFDGGRRVMGRH